MGTSSDDFAEYVSAMWPRLVRAAVLLGCQPAEAEDLVQTALTKCYSRWDRIMRTDNRDAYIHRTLVNTLRSSRRRKWRLERPSHPLPEAALPDATGDVDEIDALVQALANLNTDQRMAVVLRYYADLSEQQMADVLGVAAGTVKSRLSRAMDALAVDPNLQEV